MASNALRLCASSYFYLVLRQEITRGNGLMVNMMSRVEYFLGGNYIRRNFLDFNNPGGIFLGGNFPGGSQPEWEFSRWDFSRWELSWVGIILGGNCSGESYPGWGFSLVAVFWVGIVQGESSGWEISQYLSLNY